MKRMFLSIAICGIVMTSISSCAKCAICVNPSKSEKDKVCKTDDKEDINDMIDSYEADGWKCHASEEAI